MLECNPLKIDDERYFEKAEFIPIVFEESFSRIDQEADSQIKEINRAIQSQVSTEESEFGDCSEGPRYGGNQDFKMVFMSHGFQGTHYDNLKIKHYFGVQRPDLTFYCSTINENQTTIDIEEMGRNFANEVDNEIRVKNMIGNVTSVSFIGHSLGGVIIRSALPHLRDYKDLFQGLMTFSTPHLGVSAGDSKLVETGYNILTSWAKHLSLKQLGLRDKDKPRDCFLYRLSQTEGLQWFKEIVLVSSPQDTYSPFDSSRIQVSETNSSSKKTSEVFYEMVESLLNKIKCGKLRRVDCCMKFPKTNFDTFTGRAAHIALISDGILLEGLSYRYASLL